MIPAPEPWGFEALSTWRVHESSDVEFPGLESSTTKSANAWDLIEFLAWYWRHLAVTMSASASFSIVGYRSSAPLFGPIEGGLFPKSTEEVIGAVNHSREESGECSYSAFELLYFFDILKTPHVNDCLALLRVGLNSSAC
ncbi:hypothetical protein PIB30_041595 [Stylosanthes scabra]|uniref:Uncharacterized protein n=1 Tax=Stylosanthes scabra TaxID=79078 RepID=A0ABU6UER1_9FABA|nr:hypothetical protein [Stylosanthes scabra]